MGVLEQNGGHCVRLSRECAVEHLERVSFVWQTRRHMLDPRVPAHPPAQLSRIEDRLVGHLQGLLAAGSLGMPFCMARLSRGAADGAAYIATYLACATLHEGLLSEILQTAVARQNAPALRDFGEALGHFMPESWMPNVSQWVAQCESLATGSIGLLDVTDVLLDAVACRPALAPMASASVMDLWRGGKARTGALLRAARYFGMPEMIPVCSHALSGPDGAGSNGTRKAALLTALRLQPRQAPYMYLGERLGKTDAWAAMGLAVSGGPQSTRHIIDLLKCSAAGAQIEHSVPIAVGLHGHIAGIEPLTAALASTEANRPAGLVLEEADRESLTEQTAIGLRLITGASLDVCRSRADWTRWWGDHGRAFNPSLRYRLGVPYSAALAARSLLQEPLPTFVRAMIGFELTIRYGSALTWHSHQLVRTQRENLNPACSTADRHAPGQWVFDGYVQPH